MMLKKTSIIFFILILMSSTLFSRPDLKFDNNGNDIYGTADNATGGETTIYNTVCGNYTSVNVLIENDTDNTTTSEEVYQISITPPSSSWDYYTIYKEEKYTGNWATESIDNTTPQIFKLFVRPPDNSPAQTSSFKIVAKDGNGNTDAVTIYFNVIEKETFDLSMDVGDNLTVGDYVYYPNNSIETYYLNVNYEGTYNLSFKVKNRGNKTSNYKILIESDKYNSDTIKIYQTEDNSSVDITDAVFNGSKKFLKAGNEDVYSCEVIGKYVKESGSFTLKLYDVTSDTLIDTFVVNINNIPISENYYEMPYFYIEDNASASYLAVVNTSTQSGEVSISKICDNSSSSTYTINQKSMLLEPITDNCRFKLSSKNISFAPIIISLDNNYYINANIYPLNVSVSGKNIIFPFITESMELGSSTLFITNLSDAYNEVVVKLYSFNGELIGQSDKILKGNSYFSINIKDLTGKDTSIIYWAEVSGENELSAYLTDYLLKSYIYTYGFQNKK